MTLIAQAKELATELGQELTLARIAGLHAGPIELLAGNPAAVEQELRRPAHDAFKRMEYWGFLAT
ncbi:MAG: hypothetical protein ACTHQQ_07590, partial [Solirubrobacteraceae bacterium]